MSKYSVITGESLADSIHHLDKHQGGILDRERQRCDNS